MDPCIGCVSPSLSSFRNLDKATNGVSKAFKDFFIPIFLWKRK